MNLYQRPSWVLRGADFDLDFRNGRWWGGNVAAVQHITSLLGLSNGGANGAYTAPHRDGNRLIIFDSQFLRIVPGLGLWVEHNSANRLLHSRDLTQAAWVATNCTVARNQAGADIDGTANTANLLTATAGNGTVLQAITLASGTVISSAYVKRSVGTGTVEMTQDGGSNWTDITASINSSEYSRVNVPAATVTNPQVGFRLGTSGDAIIVDFTQCESKSYVSSPIITTTTSRSRGNEMPQFSKASAAGTNDGQRFIDTTHFSGIPLSQYVEFSGNFDGATIANIKGGGNNPTGRIQILASGVAELRTDSSPGCATANTVINGIGNINKVATRQNLAGAAICMNAGAIATTTNNKISTDNTDDHLGIGNRGAGDQALNGYLARYACWRRELTDGEMPELTR